jgi:hypothetical protein
MRWTIHSEGHDRAAQNGIGSGSPGRSPAVGWLRSIASPSGAPAFSAAPQVNKTAARIGAFPNLPFWLGC